ncbi:hypothetical protein UYSO10_4969 [Kosakonia radicincitans]|uniref:hypothetical protein n=1 Tax=Kosakonia radicincitans TaxID=283686 RepID=UPI00118446EB|nr:hypothetical protein [Kosakonia radicincitans]VVT53952.1 hypothetical protein UYSO10_4969 [Kosakonia radicincitans]
MSEWIYDLFFGIVKYYKEMTTFVLVVAIVKLIYPAIFWFLEKHSEKSYKRKRIKIWTDAGYSKEQAEEIIRRFDEQVENELKKKSFASFLKRIFTKKAP